MLYIQIANTFLFSHFSWDHWQNTTWLQMAQMTWNQIFIDPLTNAEIYPLANTLQVSDIVNDQSTCDISIIDTTNEGDFKKGMPISIYDDNFDLVFSGFVDSAKKKHIGSSSLIYMKYDLSCIDNHYLINKRKVYKGFVATTASDAVQWIVDNILAVEGITVGLITPSTKILTKIYNYVPAKDTLDELAEYAACVWFIDCNKKFYFIPKLTYVAPFNISLDEYCKCDYVLDDTFSVSDENSEVRNKEYMVGSTNKSVSQTRTFKGDGENQTWTLPLPLAEEPTISVNGVPKTVGIGSVNTGYDFYWNSGSNTISQDANGTKLIDSDTLTVVFVGYYNIIVSTANYADISNRAALEGTSGIIEDTVNDASYKTQNDALERINVLLNTYGIDSKTITYSTRIPGIEAGQYQLIYSEFYGLNHNCLITQVDKIDTDYEIEYHVTAVAGPVSDYWTKQMLAISNAYAKALAESDTVSSSDVLLILQNFSKDWLESDDPNIFKPLYPSESLLPGNIAFPCFEENETCSYIQLDISGGYRLYMLNQVVTETQIVTTFIIPSEDCNGEFTTLKVYGGNTANETLNSGVLLATFSFPYVKNSLESFQIVITFNKWVV